MKVLLLIACIFLTGLQVFCQSITVRGKVIDSETKLPLNHVAISLNGSLRGTEADSSGNFMMVLPEKVGILNFSIIGYEKKSVKIKNNSTDPFIIELERKQNTLSEIVISSSPIETVSKSKRYNVLDYDFYNDNILLITYVDLKRAKLVLINQNFDTLGYKAIPYEPSRLFKDCLGNIHVVCKDSLYQAYYDGKRLDLFTPKSIRDFESILLPCIEQDSLNFFLIQKYGAKLIEEEFRPFYSNNLGLNYFYVNKKTRIKQPLITIEDEKMMIMSNDEAAFEKRKEQSGLKTIGDRVFAETVIFKEIYAPLYNIKNNIYIFDYANSAIKYFGKANQLQQEVPITFHKSLQFSREMQIDRKTWRVFALFESNGITELKDINLSTGLINTSYKIPFPFVNHIKVQDNYIYFIRKGREYDDTRYLARLRVN